MYKIQWSNHIKEEATWETKHFLNIKYPNFLTSQTLKWTFPAYLSNFESRGEIPVKEGRL
jgi:hypothetical protein